MLRKLLNQPWLLALIFVFALVEPAFAATEASGGHAGYASTFAWIAILLLIARVSGMIERFGLPPVLGELLAGVALKNLALVGLFWFVSLEKDPSIRFLAQFGLVLLLFEVGLETNIKDLFKVGKNALLVALVGVVAPFVLGTYVVGPLLLPGLTSNAYLFLGASLAATSVGITARVFSDLGISKSKEAKTVLGAAVIDDVIGLVILAVVVAITNEGSVDPIDVSIIVAKAVGFLIAAILLGQLLAPRLSRLFSKISNTVGMKLTLVLSFGLIFAYLASLIGLDPIVGAFAAGLILDAVHFKAFSDPAIVKELTEVTESIDGPTGQKIKDVIRHHADHHVEEIIQPLGLIFIPLFFVMTGMQVNLQNFFDPAILLTGLGITVVAIVGKLAAGLFAGKGVNKWIVGWGMVPRGEVGLIFANTGKILGVIDDRTFSVIVIMIILTTLITPPVLAMLQKKAIKRDQDQAPKINPLPSMA